MKNKRHPYNNNNNDLQILAGYYNLMSNIFENLDEMEMSLKNLNLLALTQKI